MRTKVICAVWSGLLLSVIAAGQTPLTFEVASIRPSADQMAQAHVAVRTSGSQARMTYMSLKDYIGMAYGMRLRQIIGPDWIDVQRFDIVAKFPDGSSADQTPAMLQGLLADRFQLKFHRDVREFPVYALTVAKGGAKLKESPTSAGTLTDEKQGTVHYAMDGSGAGVEVNLGGGSFFHLADNRFEVKGATMLQLADALTRFADRPVLDMTALMGTYDLTLDLPSEDYTALVRRAAVNAGVIVQARGLRALDDGPANPFSRPLQKFGLTLESRKAPLDVIVVDSMRRTPTED